MSVAVVDSNVIIGFANRRDQHHEAAREILEGIDGGDLPAARITDYVAAETLNYIHERRHHDVAVELYDRLQSGSRFELVRSPEADFSRAGELFERYDQLSFVDATLVAYMQRTAVDHIYSFDDGFDGVDAIERLSTPDHPHDPT